MIIDGIKYVRAELGIDGNSGYALLGPNIQEGEAEFETVVLGNLSQSGAERRALDGNSDSAWREHMGNAVPPDAAQAIADVIGRTLLLAWSGETFALGSTPIWVRPIAIALSVKTGTPT